MRDRAAKALDLRIDGKSYRQIGAELRVSEKTAYYDVQSELALLDAACTVKAERLRDIEARRLDKWTLALAPALREGDPRAVLAAVKLMERRARLLGLDGPIKIAGAAGGPITFVDELHPPAAVAAAVATGGPGGEA